MATARNLMDFESSQEYEFCLLSPGFIITGLFFLSTLNGLKERLLADLPAMPWRIVFKSKVIESGKWVKE
jgi:hypothetical protein